RLLISPVFDKDGDLTYFFASQFDVTLERDRLVKLELDRDALETEAQRRAEDLRASEDRLGFVLRAGRLGSWTLDIPRKRLIASEICKTTFGRRPTDPFTYDDLLGSIVDQDRPRMQSAVANSIETKSDY
ncbi:hypothetical protein, partial [Acinetobacter baumannii]|uniref:hypothetical protein n=1 Tax=Acinetobacter baumannii TaxID=470 RepID=UPI003F676947|nr:histidine kinase [Acinetobacter baumannii]